MAQQGGYQYGPPQGQYPPQQQYAPPQGPPQQYNGPPQNYNQQNYNGPPQQYNQNYNQGPPPTQGFDNANGGYGGEKVDFNQAFKVDKPKWNDLWAGILFLAVMAGFVVISAISIQGYARTRGQNGSGIYNNTSITLDTSTLILFLFCIAVAIILSYAYVLLIRTFPKQLIWITGILNIVFGAVTAIYMLATKQYIGGILFAVFVVFLIFAFISWIPRIPFSALMLTTVIRVAKQHGHVYMVSFVGGMIGAAFAAWFAVTLTAVYVKYTPVNGNGACSTGVGTCSNAKVGGLVFFITFASYWFSEWLKNTIHTTVSGVYGSWYFNSKAYPTGVTRGALRRSLTYSFGSISLGSLVVAIINFLRMLAQSAQAQEAGQGNVMGQIFFCLLGCLIGILQWAAEFVNRYAFSYIALYGKPYITAAKDTWKLIKDRGIDALVNECLIGPVFTFGATFVGYACSLLAYLYLRFTNPAYNSNGGYTVPITAFAFLIGLQICNIFTTPLSSGIDTIFVAAAWDPEVMIRDHRDFYDELVRVYPKVQEAIHA